MTPEQLDEIEERAAAATPGPWRVDGYAIAAEVDTDSFLEVCSFRGNYADEDMPFVAAARTDVPALVAEVRRLREELESVCRHTNCEMISGRKRDFLYCRDCDTALDGGDW